MKDDFCLGVWAVGVLDESADRAESGDKRADGELPWLLCAPEWFSGGSYWVWTRHWRAAGLEDVEKMLVVSEKDFTLAPLSNMLAGSSDSADEAYVEVDKSDDRSSATTKVGWCVSGAGEATVRHGVRQEFGRRE